MQTNINVLKKNYSALARDVYRKLIFYKSIFKNAEF